MRTAVCAFGIALAIVLAGPYYASAQGGYTFITSERGPQICIGRWIPPRDVGLAGTCDGQLMGLTQLTALSTRETVDRLDQLISVLSDIDQKLDLNNSKLDLLIQETVNTQNSINTQVRQVSEFLHETISDRFSELPAEVLANDEFREEIEKLKEEILKDVEKRYPAKPAPPTPQTPK